MNALITQSPTRVHFPLLSPLHWSRIVVRRDGNEVLPEKCLCSVLPTLTLAFHRPLASEYLLANTSKRIVMAPALLTVHGLYNCHCRRVVALLSSCFQTSWSWYTDTLCFFCLISSCCQFIVSETVFAIAKNTILA